MAKKTKVFGLSAVVTALTALVVPVHSSAATTSSSGLPSKPLPSEFTSHFHPLVPSGFNPLTASDADLQKYGFPPRPTEPAQLEQWKIFMSHAKKQVVVPVRDLKVVPITHSRRPNVFRSDISNTTINNSENWSGYVGESTVHSAQGNWNVPYANWGKSDSGQYTLSSSWVGLGGSTNDSQHFLVQAGTESSISSSGANYAAWYEIVNLNWGTTDTGQGSTHGQVNVPLNISPGDEMGVYVWYNGTYAHFYIQDNSTNQYYIPSDIYVSGTERPSAEWITERPEHNGAFPYLTNFGYEYFSICKATDDAGITSNIANLYNPIAVYMTNYGLSSGQMATVGPLYNSGADFTDQWIWEGTSHS